MTKYQQLENLESGWKRDYLEKKLREGENITRYIDTSEIKIAIDEFNRIKKTPLDVKKWILTFLNPALENKLKQTIRARRKRYFDSEKIQTRKKSVDLTFDVWLQLSQLSEKNQLTLSQMIATLIANQNSLD